MAILETHCSRLPSTGRRKIWRMATTNVETLDVAADILIFAGQQVGLSVGDLNALLEAGMSVEQLVEYLAGKLGDRPVEN